MANEKIKTVLLKKKNSIKEIYLEEMTRVFYQENREFLFCPNSSCSANIEYCEGKKLRYFRTAKSRIEGEQIIERHIENCPYGIEHSKNRTPKSIYDPNIGYFVSDEHIEKALKRAYKKYININNDIPHITNKEKVKKKTPINTNTSETIISGKAVLGIKEEKNVAKATREPNIYQKNINEIDEKDYNTAKIIKGNVSDIIYNDNSIIIILETTNNLKSRMYFSESFKVNNLLEFQEMNLYKVYFKHQLEKGNKVFIACAGDIKKDDYDISIHVRNYKHILIDGISHSSLINKFRFLSNQ